MIVLSKRTETLINNYFSDELRSEVRDLIETFCGDNLPFCENDNSDDIDRIRFSVIKLSKGEIGKLCDAIELAQTDWRDLLMAAGFGHDPDEHKRWYNERIYEEL